MYYYIWLTKTIGKTPKNVENGHLRATLKLNFNFTSDSYEHEYFRIIINILFWAEDTQKSNNIVTIEECSASKCTCT